MGLNVCVTTLGFERHPDWDDGRYAGDRNLFEIADSISRIDHINDPGFGGANDWLWRPTDFPSFRKAVLTIPENPHRWQHLADILERDDRYWIWLSI